MLLKLRRRCCRSSRKRDFRGGNHSPHLCSSPRSALLGCGGTAVVLEAVGGQGQARPGPARPGQARHAATPPPRHAATPPARHARAACASALPSTQIRKKRIGYNPAPMVVVVVVAAAAAVAPHRGGRAGVTRNHSMRPWRAWPSQSQSRPSRDRRPPAPTLPRALHFVYNACEAHAKYTPFTNQSARAPYHAMMALPYGIPRDDTACGTSAVNNNMCCTQTHTMLDHTARRPLPRERIAQEQSLLHYSDGSRSYAEVQCVGRACIVGSGKAACHCNLVRLLVSTEV
jgi:hypothetical protein